MSEEQRNRSAVLLEFGFLWDKMADEIVRLRSERNAAVEQLRLANIDAANELADNATLRARLAAAERDAARYAFVRDNMVSVEFMHDDAWVTVIASDGRAAHKATLNEAIDALATPTTTEDA